MISYITWKIIDIDTNSVNILTKSGIWYEIIINEITYSKIYSLEETELFLYHQISESFESLFGFVEKNEKKVFKELIKISGIWWKVAIQILSLWVDRLINAVNSDDNKTIETIKWVWKKMAEKIILELKWKDFWIELTENNEIVENENNLDNDIKQEILSTLTNMGYNAKDIEKVLKKLPEDYNDLADIIPFVIRELS